MSEFNPKFEFKEWESYILHEDAAFDKYALEEAAEEQPQLMIKWLDLLAQAQAEASKAKEGVQNAESTLFLRAKKDGIPGIDKPTDATSKMWAHTQPEYKKAARRKRKADNDVTYLQNARSVLEHRKAMIKEADNLWISGYFAKPLVHENKEVNECAREEHSIALKDKLSKRHLRRHKNEE